MSFKKGKSRFLDVSREVQNIPHLFQAAIWSQKKVVLQKRDVDLWLDQPRNSTLPTTTYHQYLLTAAITRYAGMLRYVL